MKNVYIWNAVNCGGIIYCTIMCFRMTQWLAGKQVRENLVGIAEIVSKRSWPNLSSFWKISLLFITVKWQHRCILCVTMLLFVYKIPCCLKTCWHTKCHDFTKWFNWYFIWCRQIVIFLVLWCSYQVLWGTTHCYVVLSLRLHAVLLPPSAYLGTWSEWCNEGTTSVCELVNYMISHEMIQMYSDSWIIRELK